MAAEKNPAAVALGRLGGAKVKELYGPTYYSQIGRLGAVAVLERHGTEFYSRIGKKGGAARRAAKAVTP